MDDRFATLFTEAPDSAGAEVAQESPPTRYLIVLSGGIPGTMIPLGLGELEIGRSEEAGIVLTDSGVSRRHATLRMDSEGRAWLIDEGSTNGTYREGHRLAPFEAVLLRDGDRIRLGTRVVVKFTCPDSEEEEFQRSMFERTVRDGLTGLFNRSYFLDQIRTLASRATTRDLGLALLLLDIDHFKRVNDRLGHDAGDAVLQGLAALIRQATRPEDLVARYGGEEFAVAIPIATAQQALARGEHIRETLARQPLRFGDFRLKVTVSIGIAFLSRPGAREFEGLFRAADQALYEAKNGGRNRVVCASEACVRSERPTTVVDG